MIRKLVILSAIFLAACSSDTEGAENKAKKAQEKVLVEVKDGRYTEWYPGKKQIKFQGGQDDNKKRHGIWTFYAENGTELSVTMYNHGLREGHTIVKYPNGAIHYRGEYMNDETVGLWTTYDEQGNVLSEKDFGYPEQ
jgi:antitoxin component YwqK of YwqJK toxin-antitoxin module